MVDLPAVDIVFSCYEKDYPRILNEKNIQEICQKNHFQFKNIIVLINNVINRPKVEKIAQNFIDKHIITDFFFVEDYERQAFETLGLTRKEFGKVYYFTNWAFVMPFVAKSKYFIHWDPNVCFAQEGDWITPSLIEMDRNPNYFAATPVSNADPEDMKWDIVSGKETEDFYYSYSFTDIIFLANRQNLMQPIYKYQHFDCYTYPLYFIAHTFESRLGAYMRYANKQRLLCKKAVFTHIGGMGNHYPRLSFREIFKGWLWDTAYQSYQILYKSTDNEYRLNPKIIRKLVYKEYKKWRQLIGIIGSVKKTEEFHHYRW